MHELKTCLHEIEQAAIWLSHCLPTVFAFTKRKLATEKRELTKELTRLEKKLANQ